MAALALASTHLCVTSGHTFVWRSVRSSVRAGQAGPACVRRGEMRGRGRIGSRRCGSERKSRRRAWGMECAGGRWRGRGVLWDVVWCRRGADEVILCRVIVLRGRKRIRLRRAAEQGLQQSRLGHRRASAEGHARPGRRGKEEGERMERAIHAPVELPCQPPAPALAAITAPGRVRATVSTPSRVCPRLASAKQATTISSGCHQTRSPFSLIVPSQTCSPISPCILLSFCPPTPPSIHSILIRTLPYRPPIPVPCIPLSRRQSGINTFALPLPFSFEPRVCLHTFRAHPPIHPHLSCAPARHTSTPANAHAQRLLPRLLLVPRSAVRIWWAESLACVSSISQIMHALYFIFCRSIRRGEQHPASFLFA